MQAVGGGPHQVGLGVRRLAAAGAVAVAVPRGPPWQHVQPVRGGRRLRQALLLGLLGLLLLLSGLLMREAGGRRCVGGQI
jgi:hypothetical protein